MQFTARLLKSIEHRKSDYIFLVGTQHLDLNDDEVRDEIERIAPKLLPAVTRDIADSGNSISERIDDELGADAAKQVMTLLLASSLSRAVGGRIGLSDSEIIEFLGAPNRKSDEFMTALERLREQACYLHREEQRYFVKETENLSRQIERTAKEIPQPKIDQAFINRLTGMVTLSMTWSYRCSSREMGRGSIPKKKHGRLEKSWFRTGLDALRNWILHDPEKALSALRKYCPKRPISSLCGSGILQ